MLVILAGITAALHVAKLPPAIPALQEALGLTLVEAGFLLSLVQLAGMLLGLAVGLAADGLGLRRCMIAGLVVLSAASLLGGWARNVNTLLGLRAVEGFGVLVSTIPAPSLIRQLMPPRALAQMFGLWGAYIPFGTAVALLIGPVFVDAWGWRAWWWLLAFPTLLMALWLLLAVPGDRARRETPAGEEDPPAASMPGWPQRLRQTLGAPGPWLVAGCFAMYSSQWLAVIGFLPSIYSQAGFSGMATGALTAAVAAINMIGNVTSGRLMQHRVPAPVLMVTGFVVMTAGAVAAFGVWHGSSLPPVLRYLAVLAFSMLGGMIPAALIALAVRLAPSEHTVSTTIGWTQQCSSCGQLLGPPLVAWVAGLAGGWQWTWVVCGSCSMLGLLMVTRIAKLLRHAVPPRALPRTAGWPSTR